MIALVDYDSIIYKSVYRILSISQIKALYTAITPIDRNGMEILDWLKKRYPKTWERHLSNPNNIIKWSIEREIVDLSINRLEQIYNNVLAEVEAALVEDQGIEITGNEYFITTCSKSKRKTRYSDYKANRDKRINPMLKWVSLVRKYLMEYVFSFDNDFTHNDDYLEADDLLRKRASQLSNQCVIVSLDKDLKQIPGFHFDYYQVMALDENGDHILDEYGFKTKMPMKGLSYVSDQDSAYNFWYQMLVGDKTDNIDGCNGIGEVKANQILNKEMSPYDMRIAVKNTYLEMELKRRKRHWAKHFDIVPGAGAKFIEKLLDGLNEDQKMLTIKKAYETVGIESDVLPYNGFEAKAAYIKAYYLLRLWN